MFNGGWIRSTAPSPLAYERYVTPMRSAPACREPTLGELGLASGGFGSLGDASAPSTGNVIVSKGAGSAAGAVAAPAAAGIATYIGAGAAAGPIGAVVGLIVGIVVTKLLSKQYLNVSQLNAAENDQVTVFNQYRAIAGQAAGRTLGLAAMQAIWEGALYSGLFHLNHDTECFHEGCSKYPGRPEWISGTINGSASNPFTFAAAYAAAKRAGGLTAPEAQSLIDQFFIPANTRDSPPWAVPSNNLERQILYDTADAWLNTQPGLTTPYVAANPYPQPPSALPVAAASSIPGGGMATVPMIPSQPTSPWAVQQMPATDRAIASGAGYVTSTGAATQANLDAQLAAAGFTRLGTTPQGVPIYGDGQGNTYVYTNSQLYPYGTVAQLASTGNAGTGISTPVTGLDPQTLNIIAAALAQGLSPTQAAQAGQANLQAQGVPITATVQSQINAAANQAKTFLSGLSPAALIGGGVLLLFLLRR